jgi:hypothetical protein
MVDISICKKCVLGKIQDGPLKGTIWCRKFRSIVNNDSTCNYKDVDAKFELDFGSGVRYYTKTLEEAKTHVKNFGFDWNRALSTIPSEKELWNGKKSWWIDETPIPGLCIPHIVEIQEL